MNILDEYKIEYIRWNSINWKETKKDKGDSKKKVQKKCCFGGAILQYTSRFSMIFQLIPGVPEPGQFKRKECQEGRCKAPRSRAQHQLLSYRILHGCVWKCCVPLFTQWFCWSLSLLNGYNWEYTPFSDIPTCLHFVMKSSSQCETTWNLRRRTKATRAAKATKATKATKETKATSERRPK